MKGGKKLIENYLNENELWDLALILKRLAFNDIYELYAPLENFNMLWNTAPASTPSSAITSSATWA